MIPVPVLMVTYNRLEYTKKAVASVLANPGIPVRLRIWDNGSTEPGMQEWLEDFYGSAVIVKKCPRNVGLALPMNFFFKDHADFPFVAKVDNDTVLPDNWLRDLMDVMTDPHQDMKLGAVSGTCLRPYGMTGRQWLDSMPRKRFGEHLLHFNSYCLGTGVLINMEMIRRRGLLFENFPRAIGSGPDDTCLISGWTAYIREAAEYEGWKFALYSKVPVQLLNILSNDINGRGEPVHFLSHDYPEYDAEIQKVRDEGNAWWESIGGMPGVRKYVQEHGGLNKLESPSSLVDPNQYIRREQPLDPRTLTEASDLDERSTPEFWQARIDAHGTTASTFLSTPQARINEFTERHMEILKQYVPGANVCEIGCGWGRISLPIARMANEYVGVDFMPALIEKAEESLPDLRFKVADARDLPFDNEYFNLVIAVTCLSSFAGVFDEVLKELHRVLKPGGRILFLEEHFARIDWKLENE